MPRDRLKDLKVVRGDNGDDVGPDKGVVHPVDEENSMDEFLHEVEGILGEINAIHKDVEQVKRKHNAILSSPRNDEEINRDLQDLMADIKKRGQKIRKKLKEIEHNIEAEEKFSKSQAEQRIRKTQQSVLSRKFADEMADFNEAQVEFRRKFKEKMEREFKIIGIDVTNDDLEDMIEQGNTSVFTQGIIMDTQAAKQTLADIEARHADIIKLESSIKELHDMFVDMAMLVESQGEMIDRIEYHVAGAVDYVQTATQDTKQALKYQSKARKKKIYLILCLVVLAVILFVVLGSIFNLW